MLSHEQEEIMEAIWCAGEINSSSLDAVKKRCTIDFSDADLEALDKKGLIIPGDGKILLTSEGSTLARAIMRRHRLAEVLVSTILELKNSAMEKVACEVEHSLVPEVEEAICTLLGHPEICPDGKRIPRGKCCRQKLKVVGQVVTSLSSLKPSEKGKIAYIKPGSHSNLHQLISFGLQPGIEVTVHRASPTFCIKFENTELALDGEIADNIYVWKLENNS